MTTEGFDELKTDLHNLSIGIKLFLERADKKSLTLFGKCMIEAGFNK